MKIKLNKKRLYANFLLGSMWISFFLSFIIFGEALSWFSYLYLGLGILYFFHFLYDYKHQYLIINNEAIQKNKLYSFNNKIRISEINEIKKIAGDYVLKSEKLDLKIDPSVIEKESLINLNLFLKELDLPSGKNFLATQDHEN